MDEYYCHVDTSRLIMLDGGGIGEYKKWTDRASRVIPSREFAVDFSQL